MFEKYMTLKDIKSSMFPMEDDIVPVEAGGTAGGADAKPAGGSVQDDVNLDDKDKGGEGDDKGGGDDDKGKDEEPLVELDGEKFTEKQITDALNIMKNQSDFTAKNQAEAERLNTLARVIEETRQGLINRPVDTPATQTPNAIPAMTAEQFRDGLMGDNPAEALTQMVNFINDAVASKTSESKAETAFMTAHPDYLQTINSPEFKTFKSSSPLAVHLNDLSVYYEYKASITGGKVTDAKKEGIKEGEKTAILNAKAKANLKILNGRGGVVIPSKAQITPDTPHGDVLNAATNFLLSKRANQ